VNILFAGTPQIAVPALQQLADTNHRVVGVLTAPDRPSGRGRKLAASAVKLCAEHLGLTVLQPPRLGSAARDLIRPLGADLMVCVAYGRIFGPRFLELFPRGSLNLHPSLLPKYRGPAPIPAPILAGDAATGVTIQEIAQETDSGDILAQETIELDGTETSESLSVKAAQLGSRMIVDVLSSVESGNLVSRPQDHSRATFTTLIRKDDGEIDWDSPAEKIERAVRAFNPWPLAFTTFDGKRLSILEAGVVAAPADGPERPGTVLRVDSRHGILVETGNGLLALRELQLQARKALSWKSFLNGVNGFVGAVLGS
jgi:methionyl-tRNA formyltransferase